MSTKLLRNFFRRTLGNVIIFSFTVWHEGCTVQDRKALQQMIKAAQFICGKAFPVVQNIYAPGLSRGPITLSKTAHTHNTVSKYLPDGRKGLNIDFKPIVLENNCDTYMLSSYQRTWPPALLCDHFVPSLGTYCFNCGVFN